MEREYKRLSAGLRGQGVMESFRAEYEDLGSSSALMVQGQGLTQVGRFLPIAMIGPSERIHSEHCSEPMLGSILFSA